MSKRPGSKVYQQERIPLGDSLALYQNGTGQIGVTRYMATAEAPYWVRDRPDIASTVGMSRDEIRAALPHLERLLKER
jgi:hypothetical protein